MFERLDRQLLDLLTPLENPSSPPLKKLSFMAIWLVIFKNLLPESIAVLMMLWMGIESLNHPLIYLLFIACSVLLRFAWNLAILLHGFGHVFLSAIVDRDLAFINISNILEHRNISELLRSLIPAHPIFIPLVRDDVPWVAARGTTPIAIRIEAVGGMLFNAITIKLVSIALPFANYLSVDRDPNEFMIQFVINALLGANLVAIFSSLSDFVAVATGKATCFNCGNFGFVGKRLAHDGDALLPPRVVEIFHKMGRETEIRGEQAGGGIVFARDARSERVVFVGKKVLNQKRRNLTHSLESVFALVRQQAIQTGAKAVDKAIVGVWHYRYATSSPPAILETHWHEWMPARSVAVWRVEDGKWVCDRQTVNHRITHKKIVGCRETQSIHRWEERRLKRRDVFGGSFPQKARLFIRPNAPTLSTGCTTSVDELQSIHDSIHICKMQADSPSRVAARN